MLRSRARLCVAAGLALAVGVGVAGCGSDDGNGARAKPSPTASSSAPSAYLEVPDDVTLTEPGTALALGDVGTVAFERRQDEVGVLAVSVKRIERTSFAASFKGWNVDDVTAARTPYFVRVKVANAGDTDLGGMRLDNVLWADDGRTREAPNYYTAQQQPLCNGGPLPAAFPAGTTAELCQVYFIAPGQDLEHVSFLPFGGLDAITWSGAVSPVTKPTKKKPPVKGAKPTAKPTVKPTATPSAS